MAILPDLFRFEVGDVRVGLDDENLARSWLDNRGNGKVRVAADVDVAGASDEIVRRRSAGS